MTAAEYQKRWQQSHPEKVAEYQRTWREKHPSWQRAKRTLVQLEAKRAHDRAVYAREREERLRVDPAFRRSIELRQRSPAARRAAKREYGLRYFYDTGQARRRARDLEKAMRRVLRRGPPKDQTYAHRRSELGRIARRLLYCPIQRRLAKSLRGRFEKAFKARVGSVTILRLTGVSLAELKSHLEAQFKPGMTWENYGFRGWHIDHRVPVASFDLSNPAQAALCFHYTNLQPLWMKENISKGKKLVATPGGAC